MSKKLSFLFASFLMFSSLFTSISIGYEAKAASNCRNFPETGFQVCGKFLTYWQNNGGLAQQGYPVSGVFEEENQPPPAGDGKIHKVQYFQRARFEEHLENQPPYDVLLGLLGAEQLNAKYPPPTTIPNVRHLFGECQDFPETGFASCGIFIDYWNSHGGLTQQGYPISDAFDEQNQPPPAGDGNFHRVQYFQRARFEEHTENAPPFDVLLGLLGAEQYQARYAGKPPTFITDPFPSVAPPTTGAQFNSAQNVPGDIVSGALFQTLAGVPSDSEYIAPSGRAATIQGPGPKVADGAGLIT